MEMQSDQFVIRADLVWAPDRKNLETRKDAWLLIEDGLIQAISNERPPVPTSIPVLDYRGYLLIPAFSDVHLHAPQYVNSGLGYDEELLPWLNRYTFPEEARFSDTLYAGRVYRALVHELWAGGTLHSCIFASLHLPATTILMKLLVEAGLSAYVGKVNMDRNGGENLEEETASSLADTQKWLTFSRQMKGEEVKPIITPRFAPSCTDELMRGLGDLVRAEGLPVQSHLNENHGEIDWVRALYPQDENYLAVYRRFGLTPQSRTVMAHCIHNTKEEEAALLEGDILIAHCPSSNVNLKSGIMPARRYLDAGFRIGLGSDIAGGDCLCMNRVMAETVKSSKQLWLFSDRTEEPLNFGEAFYLATCGGGSFFGRTGSFETGFRFDALLIDDRARYRFRPLTLSERLEKFIYLGGPTEIVTRFMAGKILPEPEPEN